MDQFNDLQPSAKPTPPSSFPMTLLFASASISTVQVKVTFTSVKLVRLIVELMPGLLCLSTGCLNQAVDLPNRLLDSCVDQKYLRLHDRVQLFRCQISSLGLASKPRLGVACGDHNLCVPDHGLDNDWTSGLSTALSARSQAARV